MADKSFGVKEIELIGASGTPTIESPNNLDIKAVNVAISTDITVGGMVSLGAGTSISSPGTNTLTFGTNSTEKVRITSSGNVAIGHNSAPTKLGIRGTSASTDATVQIVGNGVSTLLLGQDAGGGVIRGQGGSNQIKFKVGGNGDDAATTGGIEAARFNSSGNLVFPSGQGIDFSSAAGSNSGSSSALLDDYEEGVYTPTFTCSSGSITLSGSYDIIGYEKIGNCCHVHGRVRVSSVSSPSGSLVIGLPFTRANPGEDSARIGGTCVVQNGSGAVSNYLIHPTGSTGVELARGDTSSIDVTVADNFSGNELVYISVTYRTA